MAQKRRTGTAFENDVKRLMSAAQEREFQFVTEHFKKHPKMVAMAAELIRDGQLQKLLSGEGMELKDTTRLLPVSFRKWRNLRGALALRILRALIGKDKHEALMDALQQAEAHGCEASLVKWGLGVDNDDPVPTKFSNWRNEETFISMCKERHEQLGRRLDQWDPASPLAFGYYKLVDNKPQFTCVDMGEKCDGKVFDLPLSQKVIASGNVELQNVFSLHAILSSKGGVQVKLLDCVTEEINIDDLKLPSADWELDTVRFPLHVESLTSPLRTPSTSSRADDAASDQATPGPSPRLVPPAGDGKARAVPAALAAPGGAAAPAAAAATA